jgi:hypothetical protein
MTSVQFSGSNEPPAWWNPQMRRVTSSVTVGPSRGWVWRKNTTNYVIDMWPEASRQWSMEVYIGIREFAYPFVCARKWFVQWVCLACCCVYSPEARERRISAKVSQNTCVECCHIRVSGKTFVFNWRCWWEGIRTAVVMRFTVLQLKTLLGPCPLKLS